MTATMLALGLAVYLIAMAVGYTAFRLLLDWNDERELRRVVKRRLRDLR